MVNYAPWKTMDVETEKLNARAAIDAQSALPPLNYSSSQMSELLDITAQPNTAPSLSQMTTAFNAPDYNSDDSIHNEGVPSNHVESTQAERREAARTSDWLPPINRITHFDRGSLERYCEQVLFRYDRMLRDQQQTK